MKRLLKLLREYRDNEEGYEKVLLEFERFLNLKADPLEYRYMAFEVMKFAALENPRDLRYEPYISRLVDKLLSFEEIHPLLIGDFEYLFGEYFYSEHIYPISRVFWEALKKLGSYESLLKLRDEIMMSGNELWINRAKEMGFNHPKYNVSAL